MNTERLEQEIRTTLRENVAGISDSSLRHGHHPAGLPAPTSSNRSWLAPLLSAAAVLVVAATVGAVLLPHRAAGDHTMSTGDAEAESASGSWHLQSVSIAGHATSAAQRPGVTLTFRSDGTLVIDDGVNTTMASWTREGSALAARFRSTTYVLDGRRSDPARSSVLQLLDSLAPGATPATPAHSSFQIQGTHMTIRTSAGVLDLVRSAPEAGVPGGTSTTPAAPAGGSARTSPVTPSSGAGH
jgi:heat shock protein HslJ